MTFSVRNQVGLLTFLCAFFHLDVRDNDFAFLLLVEHLNDARDLRDDRKTLRLAGFEKLLDTGKTLCDIAAGNTAGVECSHGQLRTGLTDGLSRDDTDGFADLDRLAGSHVGAVALDADAVLGTAGEDRADLDLVDRSSVLVDAVLDHALRAGRCDHVVGLDQNVAVLVVNRHGCETAGDSLLKRFDLLLAVRKLLHPHARDLVAVHGAVHLTDDQLLGDVYQTSVR